MMNDSYVVFRINQWAQWVMRRDDGGLGYPKQVPYTNLMPRTHNANITPEMSEECFEVEQCVTALRIVDEELYAVLVLSYVQINMTLEQKLKKLGCCKQTYYNKVERCHRMIYDYLLDLSIGHPLPRYENNFRNFKQSA